MAHIAETIGIERQGGAANDILARIRLWITRRRVYNRTHAELSQLSTRELDDLGISRSMITRLAQEAAYKK
jgi:uncharacterized protein YjiS (DUF1127 family)